MPEKYKNLSVTQHVVIAAALFGLEVLLAFGLIGAAGFIVAVVVLAVRTRALRERLQIAAIYLCLVVAILTLLHFNWRLAESRARPVINACRQFQRERGRYPHELTELVPAFLPSVPTARYTLIGEKFGYLEKPPELCFTVMFNGAACYDFYTSRWWTND